MFWLIRFGCDRQYKFFHNGFTAGRISSDLSGFHRILLCLSAITFFFLPEYNNSSHKAYEIDARTSNILSKTVDLGKETFKIRSIYFIIEPDAKTAAEKSSQGRAYFYGGEQGADHEGIL